MEDKTYTQDEVDKLIKEKAELSFKAGLEKGKVDDDTKAKLEKLAELEKKEQEAQEVIAKQEQEEFEKWKKLQQSDIEARKNIIKKSGSKPETTIEDKYPTV